MMKPGDARLQRNLVIAALVIPAVALVARVYTGGWLILMLGVVYLALTIFHAVFHIRLAKRVARQGVPALNYVVGSHVVLLAAFLLQWDVGDGRSWLTISALLTRGAGYPEAEWLPIRSDPPGLGVLYDLVLFVPVLVSYVLIQRSRPADLRV